MYILTGRSPPQLKSVHTNIRQHQHSSTAAHVGTNCASFRFTSFSIFIRSSSCSHEAVDSYASLPAVVCTRLVPTSRKPPPPRPNPTPNKKGHPVTTYHRAPADSRTQRLNKNTTQSSQRFTAPPAEKRQAVKEHFTPIISYLPIGQCTAPTSCSTAGIVCRYEISDQHDTRIAAPVSTVVFLASETPGILH